MAKKTTQKKAAKTGVKSKASSGKSGKTAKKTTKKTADKSTRKSAKKPTTKKSAATNKKKSTQAQAVKTKKSTRKTSNNSAEQSDARNVAAETVAVAEASPVNPSDNGKAEARTEIKPTPIKIHRVVRPTPPPQDEQDIDDWTPLSDAKLRKVKTGLTRKELDYFKQLLLEKRAEIVGDVMGMEEARASGNGGDLSNMPLHMADIGSDNYEQEFTLGLVESERKLLIEIDRALKRIQDKVYGVCIITGNPIPKARLEIKPWAKYSIEIVREREKRGLHSF